MKRIKIKSTSSSSAVTDDVLLRETQTTRLLFRPTVIDNLHDQEASVKGTLFFQKKRKGDKWEDYKEFNLSELKAEEWVSLNLKSKEILALYRALTDLYSIYQVEGIPSGESEFIKADAGLNALLSANNQDFLSLLDQESESALALVVRLMSWISLHEEPSKIVEKLETLDLAELQKINSLAGITTLKSGYSIWTGNENNSNEEFWQQAFTNYSFLLSQVFSYPVVIVKGKAYVGGKSIENKSGNLVDFLAKNEVSKNAVLIEIKTPGSKLLGSEYRKGVYSISSELSGAVVQVSKYKHSLVSDYNQVTRGSEVEIEAFDPDSLLITGNYEKELDTTEKRRSFQLFRSNLKGVQVITFDELFSKIEIMIDLIEGGNDESIIEEDILF